MSLRHCSTILCCLAMPAASLGADARSQPPAWNWGAQPFSNPFKVSATGCMNIRVPTAGVPVAADASGEGCPTNTVSHGYQFTKRTTQVALSPRYRWQPSGGRCTALGTYTGTVTNPNTGEVFPMYRNVSTEPCPRRPGGPSTYMVDYEVFEDWNYRIDYTVDPDNIFMRCCPSAQ